MAIAQQQPQSTDASVEKFTKGLSTFRREMIATMQDAASIAEKGPSYLLLGLGTAVLLLALFCAHSGDRDQSDRAIVTTPIGGS